ncbi:MAG: DNA primase [Candidatus Berkiellales bacterium]
MSAVSGGKIPESFIQSVVGKTDIVSLIQEKISLKKAGANYSACCPFHQEKTPSFSVSPTKQFYHCFGCGAHGDAIGFLMANQSLTFVEAIEHLASRLGLTVPKDPKEAAKSQRKFETTSVLNQVAEFYAHQLKHHPNAKRAVEYLKQRGLTGKIAKAYSLGFAPPGWNNLLDHFNGQPEALKVLQESGLIIKHPQGRLYDRFRDRIMFPIRDRRGEVIAFGGRVLDQGHPKYLNSPESPVFQKGHCLYGVYETLKAIQKWQMSVVVEGYFDVVMLAQFGIVGALATLGTAITSHHLTSLFQLSSEVVFCFDGDDAGQNAAFKALRLVLPFLIDGRQVRFAFLPQGEDPDSYVRRFGADDFRALLQNSMSFSEYFFATFCQRIPPHSVDNRAHLASLARPLLEQMPNGFFKEMMFEKLAEILMSSTEVVRGEKAKRFASNQKVPQTRTKVAPPPQPLAPAIIASAILLREPALYGTIKENLIKIKRQYWDETVSPGMDLLRSLFAILQTQPMLSTEEIHQQLQTKGFVKSQLTDYEKKAAFVPSEGSEAELSGSIQRLIMIGQQQIAEKLLLKAKNHGLTPEEKQELKEILQSRESIN